MQEYPRNCKALPSKHYSESISPRVAPLPSIPEAGIKAERSEESTFNPVSRFLWTAKAKTRPNHRDFKPAKLD